jgi:hypothetical protein
MYYPEQQRWYFGHKLYQDVKTTNGITPSITALEQYVKPVYNGIP